MENKDERQTLTGIMSIGLLDAKKLKFKRADGGYADMEYDGQEYRKVRIARALPHKEPARFICISDCEGNEIGMLKDAAELDGESVGVLQEELDKLYFCPTITKIYSGVDKMGFMTYDVETVQGRRKFSVADARHNIRFTDEEKTKVQITDMDGNRYLVENYEKLDSKSRKYLDTFLL